MISDGVIALRPWTPGDAGFLREASTDPAIQRYSLSRSLPFTAHEARALLREDPSYRLTIDAAGRPSGALVIVDAVTGDPLGQCGVDGWSPGDAVQIGYWLAPVARGRGLATRAVVRLAQWLFDVGARRVFLTVVDDNLASAGVAARAGLLSEGPTGEQVVWLDQRHEVVRFAVAVDDWVRRNTG